MLLHDEYMAKYPHNPSKVISFVLMVTFGLLMLVVAFATWKGGSFELRSKAATQDVLLKAWSFDTNAEGWVAKDVGSSSAGGGSLTLVVGPNASTSREDEYCTGSKKRGNYKCRTRTITTAFDPRIEHAGVQTVLRYPGNRFSLKMSVTPGGAFSKGSEWIKNPRITPIPITVYVSYKLQGRSVFEPAVPLKTVANGSLQEVVFDFPKAYSLKRVDEIQISFKELRGMANTRILVDEIRIIGLKNLGTTATVKGIVEKASEEVKGSLYRLRVAAQPKDTVYLLLQAPQPTCVPGVPCPRIGQRLIEFESYVGKEVEVRGDVDMQSEKGTENPDNIPYTSGPILYVSSISLVTTGPTATPTTTSRPTPVAEIACAPLVKKFAEDSIAPPKIVNNTVHYNWGGIEEKWFQDAKNQWYYIYLADVAREPTVNGVALTPDKSIVRRWSNGLSNNPDTTDDFSKDAFITFEWPVCYSAISPTYTFPE